MEHRNKGSDPLLTRLVYGLINWLTDVPLEKGYSQVDWMRQSRAAPPPRPRKGITMDEVRQHRSRDDAWMVFRNRVYNMTPYLRFHPGGADILMKAAGKDGTALFMKYHPWVAIDALMEKCLVGFLAEEHDGAVAQAQGQAQQPQQAPARTANEGQAQQSDRASGSGVCVGPEAADQQASQTRASSEAVAAEAGGEAMEVEEGVHGSAGSSAHLQQPQIS